MKESLSYEVVVRDKRGKVLQRVSGPSRSYVEQWNKIINVLAKQTALTIKDTGGTDRSISKSATLLTVRAGVGTVAYGLRVGKGSTAVDITDYALKTPIGEGSGSGQLAHQAVQFVLPAAIDSDYGFKVWRVMMNYSGATITGIQEIGAYVRMVSYYALAFRDVLGSPVSVPDGGSITVTYTIKVSV